MSRMALQTKHGLDLLNLHIFDESEMGGFSDSTYF